MMRNVAICVIALLILLATIPTFKDWTVDVQQKTSNSVLFLDPGHGGMDGGAVSSSGIPEKDINLAIAIKVKELAQVYGWQVVMTRETDCALYESDSESIRSVKTKDLKARRDLLREYEPKAAISIHLNSFKEDPAVAGVQVFYPDEGGDAQLLAESKAFAEIMQQSLTAKLRVTKKRTPLVRDGVFLLKEVVCPIIIVECGFLSNPQEAELLQAQSYQQKLAEGIMAGITEFTGKKKKLPDLIDSLK